MDALQQLAEALLMSLTVVGAAALHMLLGVWIIFLAFIIIALLRWGAGIVWNSAVASYKRHRR